MKIKSIELNNFFSYENQKISFNTDENNLYIINGNNYDSEDVEASNGSGKSVLIGESISYNLFGKSLRGSSRKMNQDKMVKFGSNNMSVNVEYTTPESNMMIKRIKNSSTSKVEIIRDSHNESKKDKKLNDKDIKELIGLDAEAFKHILFYYDDNVSLLSMNYSQRLEFFKDLTKLEILDTYYDKTKTFIDFNNKYKDKMINKKSNVENIISIVKENKNEYIEFLKNKIEEMKKDLTEKSKSDVFYIDLTDSENKIKKYNLYINKINDILNNFNSNEKICNSENLKYKKEIEMANKLNETPICPLCKQKVKKEDVEKTISHYNELIEMNNDKIKEIYKEKKVYKNKLDEIEDKKDELEKEYNNNKYKINKIQMIVENLERDIKKTENELKDVIDKTNKNKDISLTEYDKQLINYNKAINIRNDWDKKLDYWKKVFSPKSNLRVILLKKYIDVLSDIFEYYLSRLYSGELVGKFQIDDDSNIDILIYKNNFELDYWNLSSGERKRVSLALILSLYEFSDNILTNLPKFMLLDEILTNIDKPGIERCLSVISEFQEKHDMDVFIISHNELPLNVIENDVNIYTILVEKKNDISTVSNISELKMC